MSHLLPYPPRPLTLRAMILVLVALGALLLLVSAAALSVGSVDVPAASVLDVITGGGSASTRMIILDIRLPRLLLALLVGAGLSLAGAVFQALLRNPLAEPYILGISSGGTVGAVVAITLGLGLFGVPLLSFTGSAFVMMLVYSAARRRGQLDTYALLLAGVTIGAFFNAVVLVIIAVFNQELRNAFLWLMGNLSGASYASLLVVAPVIIIAAGILMSRGRAFNLIATGDETAMQLGVDVRGVKRVSYLLASLITGLVVSVSGVVGFVGLIVPHICRLLLGPDHRLLLPASAVGGASFLVLADLLARTVIAPAEIPVGAVTAAIGAPLFIYLLRRS